MAEINKTLLGGSLVLLLTFNLFNLLNFLYNFSMVRLLNLSEYGSLTVLLYLILIFGIFTESIQTVVSKYSTDEKDPAKIKNIIKKSFKKSILVSLAVFILYLIIAGIFSIYMGIPYLLLFIVGLTIFFSFTIPITRGVLQGKKRFKSLGFNVVSEGLLKLIFGVLLVYLGFGIYGAVLGALIGTIFAFLLSLVSIKGILDLKEKKSGTPHIYNYTKPVFIITLSVILFLSLDIIIAKILFPAELVGAYAIASTIAKIIFIGTHPISRAMFPISTEAKNKKDSRNVLVNSLAIIISILIIVLLAVYYLPKMIISLYSGKEVLEAVKIIFYLSAAMGLLSMTNLILFYKLSTGNIKNYYFCPAFVILEIILLLAFSKNLETFSIGLIISSVIFLIGSIFIIRNETFNNNSGAQ